MNKELVKHILVFENDDVIKAKYLNVYDGTGTIPKKHNSGAECVLQVGDKQYYTPFVGSIFTAKFPELVGLDDHAITDENTIKKIIENIF